MHARVEICMDNGKLYSFEPGSPKKAQRIVDEII